MDLSSAMTIAAAGMRAQSARLQVTAENLANAETTGLVPGGDPFRRHIVSFASQRERASGLELVGVARFGEDASPFELRHEPGHPAADASGYVKYPNVNPLIELVDMREAQRSYEADITVMDATKSMQSRTVDLLK
jgi:flagellar basal-body rod protein FlgC